MLEPFIGFGSDTQITESDKPVQTGLSWLDPGAVQAVAPGQPRVVTLPAATVVQILGNDIQRASFLIIKSASLVKFPMIAPSPLVQTFGMREDDTIDVRSFVLQDWISLIPGEWYAFSTAGGDIQLWEFKPSF